MNILFLDHGETYGGGQVMAARLLPLLREEGFSIDAYVGCPRLPGEPIPKTHAGLRRLIRTGGHDVVYANTPRTALAAMAARVPFLWHKHHPGVTWLQRLAARRALRVISVCRFGAPRGANVRIVPNGVPPMDAVPADDLPEGKKVLMLGRLHPEKGHDIAFAAMERITSDATLVVAGEGEMDAPEGVVHLGHRDDVASLLAACDVLLLPSRVDEGAPLAVLEAQAAGLPVVASRAGGVVEIARDPRLLVDKGDVAGTAAAIDRALAAGRQEKDTRFTLARCVGRIAAVLAECRETVPA